MTLFLWQKVILNFGLKLKITTRLYIKKSHILKYLSIVIIFTSWIIFYTIPRDLQYPIFFIPAIILILYSFYPYKKENVIAFFLFGIVIFRFFIPEEASFTNVSFWAAMIRAMLIASLFLIDQDSISQIYHYFKKILFYIIIISLPFYLLYVLGLLPIEQIATFIGEDDGRSWNVYLFFSLQDHPIRGEIIRFPAIFDEPGFLGTLLAFILIIDKMNINSKENKLFLFGGILTFSLAFYLLIFIYYLLNWEYKFRNKIYVAFTALIFLSLGYFFFQEMFFSRIADRLFNEEGLAIFYDQRVGLQTQATIISVLQSSDKSLILFGGGYQANEGSNFVEATTWIRLVFQLGVVFLFMFVLMLFFYTKKRTQNLIFLSLFLISMLQRPAIFYPIWFFILIVGLRKKR